MTEARKRRWSLNGSPLSPSSPVFSNGPFSNNNRNSSNPSLPQMVARSKSSENRTSLLAPPIASTTASRQMQRTRSTSSEGDRPEINVWWHKQQNQDNAIANNENSQHRSSSSRKPVPPPPIPPRPRSIITSRSSSSSSSLMTMNANELNSPLDVGERQSNNLTFSDNNHSASSNSLPPPQQPSSSSTTPQFDPSRAHLHYRDPEYQKWQLQQQQQQLHPESSPVFNSRPNFENDVSNRQNEVNQITNNNNVSESAKNNVARNESEKYAMDVALQASLEQSESERIKAQKEDFELRRALAESAALARSNLGNGSTQEQLDLARALLESQRDALMDQRKVQSPSKRRSLSASGQNNAVQGYERSNSFQKSVFARVPPPDDEITEAQGVLNSALSSSSSPSTSTTAQNEIAPPVYSQPLSLHESEWLLQARNEKGGSLWKEGGAHMWLPPGAASAKHDDEIEREMLELAMKISVEEEAQAKKWRKQQRLMEEQLLAGQEPSLSPFSPNYEYGPVWPESPRYEHAGSIAHGPLGSSTSPSSDSSRSTSFTRSTTATTIAPPKPSRRPPSPPLSPPSATATSHALPATIESVSSITSAEKGKGVERSSQINSTPFPSTEPQLSDMEVLSIRNPDLEPSSTEKVDHRLSASPDNAASLEEHFMSPYAGRALSLVSERSEPGESSLDSITSNRSGCGLNETSKPILPASPRSISSDSSGSTASTTRPALESEHSNENTEHIVEAPPSPPASPHRTSHDSSIKPPLPTPTAVPSLVTALPSTEQAKAETANDIISPADSESPVSLLNAPPTTFRDGVAFGWLPGVWEQELNSTSISGKIDGSFPEKIVLSSLERDRKHFAIEASSWSTLLRFMMWYGDLVVSASAGDIRAHPWRRCDCGLALAFRSNEAGQSVIRLIISLLDHNQKTSLGEHSELTMATHFQQTQGKGKGKASAKSTQASFRLPDSQVLPTRLSNIALSLSTLRHLASIALSTQAAKDASPSYHALRSLGMNIQALGKAHFDAEPKPGKGRKKEDEDLLSRMRDRLKKLRRSSQAPSTSNPSTPDPDFISFAGPTDLAAAAAGSSNTVAIGASKVHGEDVFGIGSIPNQGFFAVPSRPRFSSSSSSSNKLTKRNSVGPSPKTDARDQERSKQNVDYANGTTQGLPAGQLGPSTSSEMEVLTPRLGFGTMIRPKRIDPNGEVSDLSEDESRWLPTLQKV